MAVTMEAIMAAMLELLKKHEERACGGGLGDNIGRHRQEELD